MTLTPTNAPNQFDAANRLFRVFPMKVIQELTLRVGLTAFLIFPALSLAHGRPRPLVARIINIRGETQPEDAVGNVEVALSDHHREVWTRSWHCQLAKVAKSGLVGWTYAFAQHSRDGWMNSELCVARSRNDIIHVSASYAFIEVWDFTDHDSCVVTRSRNAHGPSRVEKFRIDTGELIADCSGSDYPEKIPEWARPFADQQ
jgi:hypothetical protein